MLVDPLLPHRASKSKIEQQSSLIPDLTFLAVVFGHVRNLPRRPSVASRLARYLLIPSFPTVSLRTQPEGVGGSMRPQKHPVNSDKYYYERVRQPSMLDFAVTTDQAHTVFA